MGQPLKVRQMDLDERVPCPIASASIRAHASTMRPIPMLSAQPLRRTFICRATLTSGCSGGWQPSEGGQAAGCWMCEL